MSYWINKIGNANASNFTEYICDSRTDIADLPISGKSGKNGDNCCFGSECLCLQDSSVWILGKDSNKWIELGV